MEKEPIDATLEALLAEPASITKVRERNAFDQLVHPFEKSLVLFGAGNLGRTVLACLRQDGIEPFAFADNNWSRYPLPVDGIPVISPAEAARKFGCTAAFVVTIWNQSHSFIETRKQLTELGCEKVVSVLPLRWKYAESLLPFLWADLPSKTIEHAEKIKSLYPLWSDSFSKKEYIAQLKLRIEGEFDLLAPPDEHESYFPKDLFEIDASEAFVDCGAYDGVTIRNFLKQRETYSGKIMAFEPDPINFVELQKFFIGLPADMRSRLFCFPYAVGERNETVHFDASGTMGSAINEMGKLEVECLRLDDVFAKNSFAPTYIKMDIEGAEYGALVGARETIEKRLPVLAICLYHRFDDLWRIPLLVKSFFPGYNLYLRPHEIENWQLVCYAIPPGRLKGKIEEAL